MITKRTKKQRFFNMRVLVFSFLFFFWGGGGGGVGGGVNKVTTQNKRCSLQSRPCYIDRLSIESCTVNCFTADCAFSKLFDKT